MASMQSSFNSIDSLIKEGENLSISALEKAKATVKDMRGRAANYASLCERVNSLGSALAQVKLEYSQLVQEKTEIVKILEQMDRLAPQEIQKLSSFLTAQ